MLIRTVVGGLALVLAACASPALEAPTPTPTSSLAPPDSSEEPVMSSPLVSPRQDPEDPPNAKQVTITGILGFDSIEGGCAYLQTDGKTRYEVLYPEGWRIDGNGLRNPDGEVAAEPGDELTLRGQLAVDMASTCQIGPIFRADEVVTIDR